MSLDMNISERIVAAIKKAHHENPGVELEVVVATKLEFTLEGSFGPENIPGLDAFKLCARMDELTQEALALTDQRGATQVEDLMAIRDQDSGRTIWPAPGASPEDIGPGRPQFCPYCGSPALTDCVGAFVQMGDSDGNSYTIEGDAAGHLCTRCGCSFLEFDTSEEDRKVVAEALGKSEDRRNELCGGTATFTPLDPKKEGQ